MTGVFALMCRTIALGGDDFGRAAMQVSIAFVHAMRRYCLRAEIWELRFRRTTLKTNKPSSSPSTLQPFAVSLLDLIVVARSRSTVYSKSIKSVDSISSRFIDLCVGAAKQTSSEENLNMLTRTWMLLMQVWRDRRGQDLIEYALMAGFVAVAAGAIMPGVSSSISTIFSKVASVMAAAAS